MGFPLRELKINYRNQRVKKTVQWLLSKFPNLYCVRRSLIAGRRFFGKDCGLSDAEGYMHSLRESVISKYLEYSRKGFKKEWIIL